MKSARDDAKPKIGAGHAEAMARQGLAELRGAFFNESNVAQPAQYGLYGTRTPGEVAEARKPEERDLDEEPKSILQERLDQVAKERDGREPEPPQLDRD
jgi:hypothetical protein